MRKLRNAATAAAILGGVGLLGAGTSHADGGALGVRQSSSCFTQVIPVDALGAVGVGSGAQSTNLLPSLGCSNNIGK
ncbi:hypothetical protein GCM10010211_60060 [Streptomyces albospinus]|uniref:Chaplin n=1 Tax=Streptomyces albospinus TaxID=285515 RepID=A0ABQ2VH32_9ACTN|nr:hypothetical protein [Streptomyces albospinus]GGU86018.1 hypothetical protein GCM10010211_60060 [Streptomyces albospinus]